MEEINAEFKLLPNTINSLRIRRNYNTVFHFTRDDRLDSWGKLESLIQIIKQSGGNGDIHKNPEGLIYFVGIVPNYSFQFIYASVFFPVVQCDTKFQNGISKGHLYILITITGDRSILPLAVAWDPSEKGDFTNMILKLFQEHLSQKKFKINNLLCA